MNSLPRLGSWGIVGVILAIVIAWMASGLILGNRHDAQATDTPAAAAPHAFTVSARVQDAQSVERRVQFNGDTQPDQTVSIASQVEGQVVAVGPRKGARVKKGDLLVRIDPRDAEAQLARAEATVTTRELEYAAAQKLRKTGYVSVTDLSSRNAALEIARADRKQAQVRLANLAIVAPADGILEERSVEVGAYTRVGDAVAKLIRIDPLVISGPVNEADIGWVKPGAGATAEVLGKTLQGRVRFVSALADSKTRTFTVEVAVDNSDAAIPAGVSARVSMPVQDIPAQKIPVSLLSLADDGTVGVKHVVDGKVVFTKANIVRADGDAVYVDGLPAHVLLITRGQGFVAAGEAVAVELEKAATAGK